MGVSLITPSNGKLNPLDKRIMSICAGSMNRWSVADFNMFWAAAAIPTATLCIISKPEHSEASVPPAKQSPAPVSLTTVADSAGKCTAILWLPFDSRVPNILLAGQSASCFEAQEYTLWSEGHNYYFNTFLKQNPCWRL
ncbi:tetratricopeptide repeat protein [Striga asiatica]|uniref:Tetratricopeptide repeat protein n=1 Tax=Striga asiatica TaxID=4170 RepID=A0A5A7QXU0_STRAF|nr:tetratricopeptide repeat protein [Striga asiatica]